MHSPARLHTSCSEAAGLGARSVNLCPKGAGSGACTAVLCPVQTPKSFLVVGTEFDTAANLKIYP